MQVLLPMCRPEGSGQQGSGLAGPHQFKDMSRSIPEGPQGTSQGLVLLDESRPVPTLLLVMMTLPLPHNEPEVPVELHRMPKQLDSWDQGIYLESCRGAAGYRPRLPSKHSTRCRIRDLWFRAYGSSKEHRMLSQTRSGGPE